MYISRVNPFGKAFSLINKSDLILVNHSGQVIDGGENRLLNTAAYMIHAAVHAARPDVMCAAHSHSIYGRAWCTLGRKIDTITQDSCAFHNDHALYESFNGIVLAEKEGKDIAACLGDKKAALLQNHGLLTVGETIEAVSYPLPSTYRPYSRLTGHRPSSGSSRSRNAAMLSSWPRLPPVREVRSRSRLLSKRLAIRIDRWALRERDGSARSRCSM